MSKDALLKLAFFAVLGSAGFLALAPALLDLAGTRAIVEELHDPVRVEGYDEHGLVLEGGARLPLAGIARLPRRSAALDEALRGRRVELGPAGAVIALVRVHHRDPRDKIRKHVARVELGSLLEFLGEGTRICSGEPYEAARRPSEFGRRGWSAAAFEDYQDWVHSRAVNP
jgi:hypothetical protein